MASRRATIKESSMGLPEPIPALFTRTSRPSKASFAVFTADSQPGTVPISPGAATRRSPPPSLSMAALTDCSVLPLMATRAPAGFREESRFLGKTGDLGAKLGQSRRWTRDVMREVGNYGEIFDTNLTGILPRDRLNTPYVEGPGKPGPALSAQRISTGRASAAFPRASPS